MRAAGNCLAFNHHHDNDLTITNRETWESLCARLPAGWHPDFLVLHLAYQTIPPALWSAPVPIVALVADWNFTFHNLRRLLTSCDMLFTDAPGSSQVLRALGYERAPAGCSCSAWSGRYPKFLAARRRKKRGSGCASLSANLHPAVQRERLVWLGRLAALADRHRVVIATNLAGVDYRALLRRSRIVFNRSVRGECNRRVFEAAASSKCCVFQEAGNARSRRAVPRPSRVCLLHRRQPRSAAGALSHPRGRAPQHRGGRSTSRPQPALRLLLGRDAPADRTALARTPCRTRQGRLPSCGTEGTEESAWPAPSKHGAEQRNPSRSCR